MDITANKLFTDFYGQQVDNNTADGAIWEYEKDITKLMIEFAKYHVVEASNKAAENAKVTVVDWDDGGISAFQVVPIYGVDSESILNAYDLNNIK